MVLQFLWLQRVSSMYQNNSVRALYNYVNVRELSLSDFHKCCSGSFGICFFSC